ncbi:uncharacterized protein [Primulina eburnea]|uniref:uncharacterized protein n=1 Tax=Primulina eburnea TaxID=1245227 RepID=UPI003C6C2CFF
MSKIIIAVATSGIAATLMQGGRTSHSHFQIPLRPTASTLCRIKKQTELAELIRRSSAIVWDEAPMANHYAFESVSKSFQDIMENQIAFGGKTMVFGGDFRQVLPVVKRGSKAEQIAASISRFKDHTMGRAIITPKNVDVDNINQMLILKFPGEEKEYTFWDSVEDDNHNPFQEEFLNSLSPSGLPRHRIILKVGSPIMLLRNVVPELGLCNGTRLICRGLGRNFIDAEIITGPHKSTRFFLHRMPLKSEDNSGLPFELARRQFPIRLSFALTINKAQGQTIQNIDIFFRNHVSSHGQLYVALSRRVSQNSTKILVKDENLHRRSGVFTRNVILRDVLLPNRE